MAGGPEEMNEVSVPHRPKEPATWKEPVQDNGIKIYPFSIDALNEDNARYWFYAMEKHMRGQFSWQAIEYHQEVGEEVYNSVLRNSTE